MPAAESTETAALSFGAMSAGSSPTFGALDDQDSDGSGGSKKILIIAAVVIVAAALGYFGLSKSELLRAGEPVALAIVGLLVMLLVVRPLIGRILDAPSAAPRNLALAGPEGQRLLTGPAGSAIAGVPTGVPAMAVPSGSPDSLDQMIDISQVEGRVRASSIKKIGEIVDKHPEEAVAIVRSWMYQNA